MTNENEQLARSTMDTLAIIDPPLAAEVQAAHARVVVARRHAHETEEHYRVLAAKACKLVEAHLREEGMPPGPDAVELLPLLHAYRKPGALYRARWTRSGRGHIAAVTEYTWDRERMCWRWGTAAWGGIHPTGIVKGRRRVEVAPERLAELCGGPCPLGREVQP